MNLNPNSLAEVESIFDGIPTHYQQASNARRFVHFLIDMVVAYFVAIAIFVLIALSSTRMATWVFTLDNSVGGWWLDRLLTGLIIGLVFTIIEGASKGRSLGKLITKSKAIRKDGSPITWGDAFKRSFSRLIPFEPFSIFGSEVWHDRISGTQVVIMP